MSITIGRDVQQAYETIVAGTGITWSVFAYEGQSELKVQATGQDDLSEFPDEFSDGRLQYAFLRILEPNSRLPKFVLIGWCGDGAPRKGIFQQHFSSVASKLNGYHVQITARSDEDVSEASIMKKVEDASGAKYSMASTTSLFGPATSTKKPTTNSLVNQLKGQNAPAFNSRKPTQTEPRLPTITPKLSRAPVASLSGKRDDSWDAPKPSTAPKSKVQDSPVRTLRTTEEPIKSSYQPIGRPDIDALRSQAQTDSPSLTSEKTGTAYQPADIPKTGSLDDRMSAFTKPSSSDSSPPASRKVSNPLASRFGSGASGTKPLVPTGAPRESKAIGGLARNFGSEGGKTPSQLWAERKARERGESIPEPMKEAPVKATTYGRDDDEQDSNNVGALRERFANTSMAEDVPPVPVSNQSHATATRSISPETSYKEPEAPSEDDEESESAHGTAPPVTTSTRPGHSAISAQSSPAAPVQAEELYEEDDAPPPVRERLLSPEPASIKHDFKAQLEQSLGGSNAAGSAPLFGQEASASAVEQSTTLTAKVLYEYEAQEDNELSLIEGGTGMSFSKSSLYLLTFIVTDIEQIDEGWWSGRNPQSGDTGLFPSNYVELIDSNSANVNGSEAVATTAPAAESGHNSSKGEGICAIATYEYEAAEEGEIGFTEGETIEAIDQIDEGWWSGTNSKGETGLFPSNYVELVG